MTAMNFLALLHETQKQKNKDLVIKAIAEDVDI